MLASRRTLLRGFLALPVAARFAPVVEPRWWIANLGYRRSETMTPDWMAEYRAGVEASAAAWLVLLRAQREAADENVRQWYAAYAGDEKPHPFGDDWPG